MKIIQTVALCMLTTITANQSYATGGNPLFFLASEKAKQPVSLLETLEQDDVIKATKLVSLFIKDNIPDANNCNGKLTDDGKWVVIVATASLLRGLGDGWWTVEWLTNLKESLAIAKISTTITVAKLVEEFNNPAVRNAIGGEFNAPNTKLTAGNIVKRAENMDVEAVQKLDEKAFPNIGALLKVLREQVEKAKQPVSLLETLELDDLIKFTKLVSGGIKDNIPDANNGNGKLTDDGKQVVIVATASLLRGLVDENFAELDLGVLRGKFRVLMLPNDPIITASGLVEECNNLDVQKAIGGKFNASNTKLTAGNIVKRAEKVNIDEVKKLISASQSQYPNIVALLKVLREQVEKTENGSHPNEILNDGSGQSGGGLPPANANNSPIMIGADYKNLTTDTARDVFEKLDLDALNMVPTDDLQAGVGDILLEVLQAKAEELEEQQQPTKEKPKKEDSKKEEPKKEENQSTKDQINQFKKGYFKTTYKYQGKDFQVDALLKVATGPEVQKVIANPALRPRMMTLWAQRLKAEQNKDK